MTILGADAESPTIDTTRVFDSPTLPANEEALSVLSRGVEDVDLAAPAVVLPDFHHKSDLEMPSSIAVATQHTIRPEFTSASVNCGMALIGLDMDTPTPEAIAAFYAAVKGRYPHPPTWRPELSMKEVEQAAELGAAFGAERTGLDEEALDRIEESGRLSLDKFGGVERLRRELPSLSFQVSRFRFGTIGPSNHFVELQEVEEILDEPAATALGVRQGQVTLQYHAGGGLLTGQVGRLFARRKKMHRSLALQMAIARPLAHLATARSRAQIAERMALYFRPGCPVFERDSDEGTRVMLANAAAMNYGFAFRAATYGALTGWAKDIFGARSSQLIVDSPHNSMYEEDVDGVDAVVHRHNSCRAFPAERMKPGTVFGEVGQAVLLPGTHRTSSYLCVAASGADRSLYSACHGAGTVVSQFSKDGNDTPPPHSTLRFRYKEDEPTSVTHLDDRGVNEALGILTNNGLVRPVARMRPIAVLH